MVDISPMKNSDSDENILQIIKQKKIVIDFCTPEKQKSVINLYSLVNPMLVTFFPYINLLIKLSMKQQFTVRDKTFQMFVEVGLFLE